MEIFLGNMRFSGANSVPTLQGVKGVFEERARARPEAAKANLEQFIDDSVLRELEREGFFKKLYPEGK